MKPRLKPSKGYAFRIIIIDKLGRYLFDDINNPNALPHLTDRLVSEYKEKFDPREAILKADAELSGIKLERIKLPSKPKV